MKKLIIGLGAVTAVAAIALIKSLSIYNNTVTVQYDNGDYSFKVPKSVKFIEGDETSYNFSYLGEEITVSTDSYNCTPELAGKFLSYYETDGETKKLEGCKYTCWVRSSEFDVVDEPTVGLSYILGTDTRFLRIDSSCNEKKAEKFRKVMDTIAKSAEYTGDFHIADKPAVYDYEMLSIDTGPKFGCTDTTEEAVLGDKSIVLSILERYAEADDPDNIDIPMVTVKVMEKGSPASELADKKYDSLMEDPDKYTDLTRDKQNRFGSDCEHICYEYDLYNNNEQPECFDFYWFDSGKYTYAVSAVYQKDIGEADASEMLDGITVKAQ